MLIGEYEGNPCLAMRYTGSSNEDKGFPTSFGKPTWFVVPTLFVKAIIESIDEHKKREILKYLKY